jgi:CRISPR-associated protein Cas2
MRYVATCGIVGDCRREDVASLLSGYGPRVQLSVFKRDLRPLRGGAGLRPGRGNGLTRPGTRSRLYPLDNRAAWQWPSWERV